MTFTQSIQSITRELPVGLLINQSTLSSLSESLLQSKESSSSPYSASSFCCLQRCISSRPRKRFSKAATASTSLTVGRKKPKLQFQLDKSLHGIISPICMHLYNNTIDLNTRCDSTWREYNYFNCIHFNVFTFGRYISHSREIPDKQIGLF